VFNARNGLIEGILVRGEVDYVSRNGCRLSNVCADDACRGEDVTTISVVTDKLPGLEHQERVARVGPTFASLLSSIGAAGENP
jgi:hypothetical protein